MTSSKKQVYDWRDANPDTTLNETINALPNIKRNTVASNFTRYNKEDRTKEQNAIKNPVAFLENKRIVERPESINSEFVQELLLDQYVLDPDDKDVRRDILKFWEKQQNVKHVINDDDELDISLLKKMGDPISTINL